MGAAEWDEDVRRRVHALTETITYSVFLHTSQGLFETDKLTFLSHTAFQVRDSPCPPRPTHLTHLTLLTLHTHLPPPSQLSSSSIKALFCPHISSN